MPRKPMKKGKNSKSIRNGVGQGEAMSRSFLRSVRAWERKAGVKP